MIDWWRGLPQPARAATATFSLALAAVLVLVLFTLVGMLVENVNRISQAVPRYERVAGYVGTEDRLSAAIDAYDSELSRLAMPATLDSSEAGARLQQALRQYAEQSALTISGSQLMSADPVDQEDPDAEPVFERLVVSLSMSGEPAGVKEFLASVYEHEPLLNVESVSVVVRRLSARQRQRLQRSGQKVDDEVLNVRATVSAMKVLP